MTCRLFVQSIVISTDIRCGDTVNPINKVSKPATFGWRLRTETEVNIAPSVLHSPGLSVSIREPPPDASCASIYCKSASL